MDVDDISDIFQRLDDRFGAEESALFGTQPQYSSSSCDLRPLDGQTMLRKTVFKQFANPDITLNFTQLENMTPLGSDSSLSPLLSGYPTPANTDTSLSTPALSASLTPGSSDSELSPYRDISDLISSPSLTLYDLSPLYADSIPLPENAWESSLIPAQEDFLSSGLFSLQQSSESEPAAKIESSDESIPCFIVPADSESRDEQQPVSPKRRRVTPPVPETMVAPASPPKRATGAKGKPRQRRKVSTAKATRRKAASTTVANPANFELDLSGAWLKLSPPSNDNVSPHASVPSLPLPPSFSPVPAASSPLKRKREVTSPSPLLTPPLLMPEDEPMVSDSIAHDPSLDVQGTHADNAEEDAQQESAGCASNSSIDKDFQIAQAYATRRKSDRSRPNVSYEGLDEDDTSDAKVAKSRKNKPTWESAAKNKGRKTKPTWESAAKDKGPTEPPLAKPSKKVSSFICPFDFVCRRRTFTRNSDLIRHLETNGVHGQHKQEIGFPCPTCGNSLARGDALDRHIKMSACGKRSTNKKAKSPRYSPEEEEKMKEIYNSGHPAIEESKRRLDTPEEKSPDAQEEESPEPKKTRKSSKRA